MSGTHLKGTHEVVTKGVDLTGQELPWFSRVLQEVC